MEIELKLHLEAEAEAESLARHLGPPLSTLHQSNLYFDDSRRRWRAEGLAVRLRRENGELILCIKSAGKRRGDFMVRGEWESVLDPRREEELRAGGEPLQQEAMRLLRSSEAGARVKLLRDAMLRPVGEMENLRRRFRLPYAEQPPPAAPATSAPLIVELDRTRYPNGEIVFELEMEIDETTDRDQAIEQLRLLFSRAQVAWRPSTISKRERLERILQEGDAPADGLL